MKQYYFLFLFLCAGFVKAQTFSIDPAFGTSGAASTFSECRAPVVVENNKLVVAGGVDGTYNVSTATLQAKKYNGDGTLDTSFGTNGVFKYFPASYNRRFSVYSTAVQPDGKIIIGGRTHIIGGFSYYYDFFLLRINANGTVDPTFGTNGLMVMSVNTSYSIRELFNDIEIDSSGRIIAAGYSDTSDTSNPKPAALAMRFLPDGQIDTTFANNGIYKTEYTEGEAYTSIKRTDDGSLFLLGTRTITQNVTQHVLLVKLSNDGIPDATFGTAGILTFNFSSGISYASNLFFMPDNKLMLIGGGNGSVGFAKFNGDGTFDTSYSTDGKNLVNVPVANHYSPTGNNATLLPNGKFMIFASCMRNDNSSNNFDYVVARFNADTTLDTTFGTNGSFVNVTTAVTEYANDLSPLEDGSVLLTCNFNASSGLVSGGSVSRYLNAYTPALGTPSFDETSVVLFPNPVTDILHIKTTQTLLDGEMYNMEGKRVRKVSPVSGQVDFSGIEKGVYFLKLYFEGGTVYKKIIRE